MSDARHRNPFLAPSEDVNGLASAAFGGARWSIDSAVIPDCVDRRFGLPDNACDGEIRQRVVSELQRRLGSHVRHFQMSALPDGLILRGEARSYYAKQLAQQVVRGVSGLSILTNDIEVLCVDFSDDRN